MIAARTDRPRVTHAVMVGVVGVLAAAVLPGCGPDERRGPVEIDGATLEGPSSIQLVLPSCHGDPEVTALVEGADRVEVEVTTTTFREGDSCQDLLVVELEAPLGDRELVDATSDEAVRVQSTSPGS